MGGREALTGRSLCLACVFSRAVSGRLGQAYVLCRNDSIPEKYPRQPVRACDGYEAAKSYE